MIKSRFSYRKLVPETAAMLSLVAMLSSIGSMPARAQDRPVPVVVLRRAAEIAQALPASLSVYLAIDLEFPFGVIAMDSIRDQVVNAGKMSSRTYVIVGPVQGGQSQPNSWPPCCCRHRADSYMVCPFRTPSKAMSPGGEFSSATEIVILFRNKESIDTAMVFTPEEGDAVFFTPSAMDKFVFPYYAGVYGVTAAARMRQEYVDGSSMFLAERK